MAPIPTRRLTLLDSMILIVALAASLPATRQIMGEVVVPWAKPDPWYFPGLGGRVLYIIQAVSTGLLPCLECLTIALTALQWRRPRLTFRMLGHGPGLVACGVATVVLVAEAVLGMEQAWGRTLSELHYWWLPLGIKNVGGAVLGAWIAQTLAGRRRWGRDSLDKLGQVLGVCWVIAYLSMFYNND